MKPGTLYGVGVGPGDPELLTLKALRVLRTVSVVFAAASSKNSYSLAVDIVWFKVFMMPVDWYAVTHGFWAKL